MRRALGIIATIALLADAPGGTASSGGPTPTAAPPIGGSPVVNPSATNAASDLVGSWHRAQTCQEMLAAFERAGLAKSHVQSLARGPLQHSHFFTASGAFGSRDENGQQVDEGDYVDVDANTLAFPSHATEFGYAGALVVDYAIKNGVLTFDLTLPQPCEGSCADAYAWALSAFASGPWSSGDVP